MRDYDSIAKSLRCCVSDSEPCEHCNCELEECTPKTIMEIAADAIEELLAAVPKWISVGADQKCPVTMAACAVGYFNGGKYDQLYWFDFFSTDKNGVIVPHNTDIEGRCIAAYTLPEPPKEVKR